MSAFELWHERDHKLESMWLVEWEWRAGRGFFIVSERDEKYAKKIAQAVFEKVSGYTSVKIFDEDNPIAYITTLKNEQVWHRGNAAPATSDSAGDTVQKEG